VSAAPKEFDLIAAITDFEAGELTQGQSLVLFAHLVRTRTVWGLQGSYGRTAVNLIEQGLLTDEGEITDYGREVIEEDE
jgi:hypothetical protein